MVGWIPTSATRAANEQGCKDHLISSIIPKGISKHSAAKETFAAAAGVGLQSPAAEESRTVCLFSANAQVAKTNSRDGLRDRWGDSWLRRLLA